MSITTSFAPARAAAAKGTPIPGAMIVVRNGDPSAPNAFLQYRLNTVVVTHITTSAAVGDEGVEETVELKYGSLTQRYVLTTATGVKTPIVNGWDQVVSKQMTDWDGPIVG